MPTRSKNTTARRSATTGKQPAAAKPKSGAKIARGSRSQMHAQSVPAPVDESTRREMIAVAAYFHAEQRGFFPDDQVRDWLQAEAEIEKMLLR